MKKLKKFSIIIIILLILGAGFYAANEKYDITHRFAALITPDAPPTADIPEESSPGPRRLLPPLPPGMAFRRMTILKVW